MGHGVFFAQFGQNLPHVIRQPLPDIFVDAKAAGHLRADPNQGHIGCNFVVLVWKCAGDDNNDTVSNSGLNLVVIGGQCSVDRAPRQLT